MRHFVSAPTATVVALLFVIQVVSCGGGGGGGGSSADLPTTLAAQNAAAASFTAKATELATAIAETQTLLDGMSASDTTRIALAQTAWESYLSPLAASAADQANALHAAEQTIAASRAAARSRADGEIHSKDEAVILAGIFLTLTALFAGAYTAVSKNLKTCDGNEPPQWFVCAKAVTPKAVTELSTHVIQSGATAIITPALPAGGLKSAIEAGGAVSDLYGIKQACTDNRAALTAAADAQYYIGTPSGDNFGNIPEGEWTFVAFSSGNARAIATCTVIQPNQTTSVTFSATPIASATGGGETATPTDPSAWLLGTWNETGYAYNSCAKATIDGTVTFNASGAFSESYTYRGYHCDGSLVSEESSTLTGGWIWADNVLTKGNCTGAAPANTRSISLTCPADAYTWYYTLTK